MTHLKDNKGYGHSQNMYIPLIQGSSTLSTPCSPTPGARQCLGTLRAVPAGGPNLGVLLASRGWRPGLLPKLLQRTGQGPTVEGTVQTEDIDAAEAEG